MTQISAPHVSPVQLSQRPDDPSLRDAAIALEASFLAEMLKAAGFGKAQEAFSGGAGEDQFSSFLVQEQATRMARAGGIGLAETIFQAMKARADV